jgi:hypothetical protein
MGKNSKTREKALADPETRVLALRDQGGLAAVARQLREAAAAGTAAAGGAIALTPTRVPVQYLEEKPIAMDGDSGGGGGGGGGGWA